MIRSKNEHDGRNGHLVPSGKRSVGTTLTSSSRLVTKFGSVLPSRVRDRFVTPIQGVLALLGKVLAGPGTVLRGVRRIVRTLLRTPNQVIRVLARRASHLERSLATAVSTLDTTMNQIVNEIASALRLACRRISGMLQSLHPAALLGAFCVDSLGPNNLRFLLGGLGTSGQSTVTSLL